MQANLFGIIALAAVVLTVQSAPAETTLGDFETNEAQTDVAQADVVQADAAQIEAAQTAGFHKVYVVSTLNLHNAPYVSFLRD